jgi:hypothetical protein
MDPIALATLAAQTVVTAATTDVWDMTKRGVSRLLGRGDVNREQRTEQRLDRTHQQLQSVSSQELELARGDLEATWRIRLIDLLEEHPEAAGDLLALVNQIRAELPSSIIASADHSVAAAKDVNITASGGVAAGSIHGDVSLTNPRNPGLAEG